MKNKTNINVSVDIKEPEQVINAISEAVTAAIELQAALNKFNLAIQSLPIELRAKTSCRDKIQ